MRRETFDYAGRDPLSSTLMHDSASLPQWARGSEHSGSLMPPALFLIADACLNICDHTPQLFSQLDSPLPVHLLGVERCNHLRTIQGMAAHLIEEIRLVQPCGSYRIAGRGMAGLLAYEIGLQLVGADQEVEFVGLIETCVPALPGRCDFASGGPMQVMGSAIDDTTDRSVQRAWVPPQSLLEAASQYIVDPAPLTLHWFGGPVVQAPQLAGGWTAIAPPDSLRIDELPSVSGTPGDPSWFVSTGLALARVIDGMQSEERIVSKDDYSPLVTIQSGTRGVSPYFCVPGAGASVVDFVALAAMLGDEYPVHAFQPRGSDGQYLPYSTVEAAAAAYLKNIEQIRPSGDLHLVGHSFGGWIAFEMALRLQGEGREICSLTLLDSEVPGCSTRVGHEYTRPEAIMELITLFELAAEKSLDLRQEDFEGLAIKAQLALLHERLVKVGLMSARSSAEALRGTLRCFETALRTRYRPTGTYSGVTRLVLVSAVGESADVADPRLQDVAAAWRRLAPHLEYRRESGNHVTLLKQPYITSVAKWMRNRVHSAQRKSVCTSEHSYRMASL